MITIKKGRNGKFRVTYSGKNNEVLAVSETLNTKQACWKNIKAMPLLLCDTLFVTDASVKPSIEYALDANHIATKL